MKPRLVAGAACLVVLVLLGQNFFQESKAQEAKTTDPFKELKFRSIGPAAGGRVSRSVGVPTQV